jgi:D-serine deaminase-like pyridoxal phosphate-dependent protein
MSVKKILIEFTFQKNLQEGFDPEGSPDLKYYAFDWDDNIVTMPTQIIVLSYDDEEVGISTEDFAEFRTMIGNEPFEYKGKEPLKIGDLVFFRHAKAGELCERFNELILVRANKIEQIVREQYEEIT